VKRLPFFDSKNT